MPARSPAATPATPPPMTLSRLLAAAATSGPAALAGAVLPEGSPDPLVHDVVQAHDRARAGALFVARAGASFDAHDRVRAAVAAGAVAVVGERAQSDLPEPPGVPYVRVPDARLALPHLAAAFHGHPSRALTVVGVTGTDGKTTTSTLLHWLLADRYLAGLVSTAGVRLGANAVPMEGHFTTPESTEVQALLAHFRDGGASHVVLESSSHGFSLHRLDAVDYDLGVYTNLSHEHLDHHGTWEAYREAKATLLRRSRSAVVNLDDGEAGYFAGAAAGRVIGYGSAEAADVRLLAVTPRAGGLALRLSVDGASHSGWLPLPGEFNASNAAAAVAAAVALGVEPASAVARLEGFPGVPGRMQTVQREPFRVIVDFAHTPPALAKALAVVRQGARRVIVVIGAAGERDPGKRGPLGREAARGSDLAIFTEEDSRSEDVSVILATMVAGAEAEGAEAGSDFLVVPDRGEAIRTAVRAAHAGDVVLLAGKGHEATLERAHETVAWDEVAAARAALLDT